MQFGTEENGIIAENLEFVFTNFVIKKQANAKDIIESAIEANNYTITLTQGLNGYKVTSKFFENAALFDWKNTIDDVGENYGYAENATGALMAAMQPLIIVLMAAIVVPIILAIMMPMFNMYNSF